MKKLIGTLIICMAVVLNCTTVFADDNLKDNLRLNVNQNNQSAINVNNNTNKNESYNIVKQNIVGDNSLNFEITPVKTFQVMPDGIIYQELQRNYNAIDPKKEGNVNSYYPGLRGPNQLNIYTPLYGLRTGTNEFGTEAIVENNMVVRMNGADSIIPRNGFVISGHGSAKNWINKNIQIGSKVYIDYSLGAIRIYLTPESLIFAAKEKLTEVNNLIDYYKKIDILYNDKKAGELMESSKEALRKAEKKPEKTQSYINEAMDSLNLAIKNAIPYYENELKGVWIRPVEKTPEAIVKTVERIANTGITDIFLETYFHGKTIYPSEYLRKYGVIPQREELDQEFNEQLVIEYYSR